MPVLLDDHNNVIACISEGDTAGARGGAFFRVGYALTVPDCLGRKTLVNIEYLKLSRNKKYEDCFRYHAVKRICEVTDQPEFLIV